MIADDIRVKDVRQGDLVFILNKEKPMKTGWYRKIRESNYFYGKVKDDNIFFVFERAIHPKFNAQDESMSLSRKTRGVFHMKGSTIEHDEICCKGKYQILVRTTGITATKILLNDYRVTCSEAELEELSDITITEDGIYCLEQLGLLGKKHESKLDKYIKTILEGNSNY